MSLLWAYIIITGMTLIESGELSLLVAGFLYHLHAITLGGAALTVFAGLMISDLLWYRFGERIYDIPFLSRLEPKFAHFDEHIRERPLAVAMLARFSYGTHRLTISRYRKNGVSPLSMIRISLATVVPWMLTVGLVVLGLERALPWLGHAFRFAEVILAAVFILLFILEIGIANRIRSASAFVNGALIDILAPPTAWTRRFVMLYGLALVVLFFILIFTPVLVRGGITPFTEESVEVMLLTLVSLTGIFVYRAYARQLRRAQAQYDDMARHLGALNLQTLQVEGLLDDLVRIPDSKKDFLRALESLNTNVLAAVPVPWVLTRIIDRDTGRTLTEHLSVRVGVAKQGLPEVSNKALLNARRVRGCETYRSDQDNTHIRVACVIPHKSLNQHQRVVVKVAVNSIALLYLVFAGRQEADLDAADTQEDAAAQ